MLPKTILPAAVVGAALAAAVAATGAKIPSAADILKKSDEVGLAQTTRIELTQTVVAPDDERRTFEMVSYSENGNEKGLTEYLSPNQVRGMKILTLNDGDDIWVYFPRTNRVRKIASSARNRKVQGSDFTYDDMASGKMAKSWKGTVLGGEQKNGVQCWKLALKPTKSGPRSYSKVTAWFDKANSTAVSIDYYDLDGEKTKRLDISGYEKINKVLIPHNYTMTNELDGGKTVMRVKKAEVNLRLKPGLFTEAGLGK
jgi:outer membrane lipoprotein-sorting protein